MRLAGMKCPVARPRRKIIPRPLRISTNLTLGNRLEPGKDGVGDYTRKLACVINNNGYKAKIIAINDRRLDEEEYTGTQTDEGTEIAVLRLSSKLSWDIRVQKAKAFVEAFDPGWISLQYVPFGFHIKGLPFALSTRL